ncbi:uncharacterized protein MONOS_1036 [Monocercomonoides exilis]|uniref:uncharacterized protein n=1 Tax=Monocercomonoides exilis TaxID=2049356 RepID=UPI003559F5B7|nr:hypothetical protein MONOS_1036 [Monocercomonoides exilis]|eukprot:MONOS_1036.1-p1 / transcript=MONOS_1036.1 / gene=MONOS_1036 / organism=Monocercomonoides_exilis_PA203 / gene_product=unspecified product / transcript_product=unspecified product / location=Mono_scaffold00017:171507-172797(-) / protein_length=340 / sequence_SO=supercontig / SO=protein_coding / is_pseudo=false
MEGVRRLEELFEEMMEAKEMHLPVVREQIMHNQMCIDMTLEDVEEMLGNAVQRGRRAAAPDTSGACTCCEWHVMELEVEKEGLGLQIRELKEQHEEAKQEMEKRYSEFNMLLQKIRDDERISKRTRGLAEQLQEKVKIIRMRERKILELSEKNNAEVKELQEQLVAMKEKAELFDVRIEKEKKRRTQQGGVCQEKFAASIRDGSAVVLGPDTSGKGVVVKAGSGVSVVGEANSSGGEGGGGGSEGTRSLISERSEKNSAGTSGGGGGAEGGVDASVRQKMNKMEKETKMLMALSKVQKQTISEQKALYNEVIEKQQTALAQKKQEQKKMKKLIKRPSSD